MCAVIERISRILEGAEYLVEWLAALPYIMLSNEYDVCLGKIWELCPLADRAGVDHAAVVASTPWNRALVAALYLHIVDRLAIRCKGVEADRTSVEIRRILLGENLCHVQTLISHHGTEDDLHTRDIPVKTTVEEGVVHQTKLFDLLKILVLILLACYDNHLNSHALPIFYRDFHFFARMSFFLRTKHIISNLRSRFFLCLLHDVRIKVSRNGNFL